MAGTTQQVSADRGAYCATHGSVGRVMRTTALAGLWLLLSAAGCVRSLGRDFGAGAAEGVRPGAVAALQQAGDTAVRIASRAYDSSFHPRITATVAGVLDTVDSRVSRMETSTAAFVEGPLSRALRTLIVQNLAVARDTGLQAAGALVTEVGRAGRVALPPVGAEFAATTVSSGVAALDAGLRGPLRRTLLALVVEIADSVRSEARRTAEEPAVKSLFARLGLVGGLVVGAVVALIALLGMNLRNSRRALLAVTTAVRDAGTPEIRRAVRERAQARRVEGWLHGYLAKRDLLESGRERPS